MKGVRWGRPTTLPWGIVFPNAGPLPRHPSELYEAALEGVAIFVALRVVTHGLKLLPRRGVSTGVFLLLYGLFRIALEGVREPDRGMPNFPLGLTMGMLLSIPLVVGGLYLLWRARRPEALAPAAPPEALKAGTGPRPPELAADPFPAYEAEAAEPFAPDRFASGRPDDSARPA